MAASSFMLSNERIMLAYCCEDLLNDLSPEKRGLTWGGKEARKKLISYEYCMCTGTGNKKEGKANGI